LYREFNPISLVQPRLVLAIWYDDEPSHIVAVVSGARRHSDWQLEDVCGTCFFDEATRSGRLGVCVLCCVSVGFVV
jgi:hypothetical protein